VGLKHLIFLCVSFLYTSITSAQKKAVSKTTTAPFQGVKEFCSFSKPLKFKVSITGNKVIITRIYNDNTRQVNGIIKNGKLYTNDPAEKRFHFAGKYYLLTGSSLSINNLEGGDYIQYQRCN
jgi:hypothetical protein